MQRTQSNKKYRIANWEKYQSPPRKDRPNSKIQWVKLHKSLLSDAKFFKLSYPERCWFLLSLLSVDNLWINGELPEWDDLAHILHEPDFDPQNLIKLGFFEEYSECVTSGKPVGNQWATTDGPRSDQIRSDKTRSETADPIGSVIGGLTSSPIDDYTVMGATELAENFCRYEKNPTNSMLFWLTTIDKFDRLQRRAELTDILRDMDTRKKENAMPDNPGAVMNVESKTILERLKLAQEQK